ncbi:MAG: hypothetical protein JNL69_06830 [Bacteroidia bacterium]|nr:hypothetical protein [Bacteroidia bacterium]
MKAYVLILSIVVSLLSSCKSSKDSSASASNASAIGKTTGVVSHKYKATGCSSVIVVKQDGEELTLIPKDKLSGKLDVDGLEVTFDYNPLKMPQPEGCTVGMPAEITNLAKK